MNDPIARFESNVRGYARSFPAVFESAVGSTMTDQAGREYIDFFCGAGSLNYGHNHRGAKEALLKYIAGDGIQHSLDMVTVAKAEFVESFRRTILHPRDLNYRLQFTGPTGTNAIEAAIKLAKKQTGRSHVVAFTNAYHGHSLGSLALTGNQYYHHENYGSHNNVTHLPFDGYLRGVDTSSIFEKMLFDRGSGLPMPAAVILETIQGEGGVNVAGDGWLRQIAEICRVHDIRLIIDDIQVGNGRSGKFFSFEHAGIVPDMVCLSKSIGGGLPMSLVLIKPEFDVWRPGEHTGTFRGNNLAFVAAAAVLKHWESSEFETEIRQRGDIIRERFESIAARHQDKGITVRGRGMIWGLDLQCGDRASAITRQAFKSGLLIESAGVRDHVLKAMPALTIEIDLLQAGLEVLETAIEQVLAQETLVQTAPLETPVAIPESNTAKTPIVPILDTTTGLLGITSTDLSLS
ncbi:diaminobutyrate--2-oxoglutarate transaminase [Neorhodopirellula pilleata]|uniref:Diaminobutyrate--2-oxoglutarate transaminase n=1 Tax=Neorhodopirellula pilleata TaxID=2714738 RepID=A0A5C6AW64_9BACT|nr:diaminobutyrate--2-oxoglutarate transaminase [Neorhodopirellula pilleata]TWU03316.1 Diaminobutyrate--2-oxoglutarate transaminase [Neorhodopirellula pilleata]